VEATLQRVERALKVEATLQRVERGTIAEALVTLERVERVERALW
jgi:hypothetical protein